MQPRWTDILMAGERNVSTLFDGTSEFPTSHRIILKGRIWYVWLPIEVWIGNMFEVGAL